MKVRGFGIVALALSTVALALTGCGKPPEAAGGNADQVAQGGPLYVAHCAKCHGPTGAGSDKNHVPPVVGKEALPLAASGLEADRAISHREGCPRLRPRRDARR